MRDFCKWNWIHSCKQLFVKSYELNYWYQELGGKFTVFLEIKKSEIKNQHRKKDNSHIIGNRKAKSENPKAKSEKRQPVSKAKSENPKAKSENPKAKIQKRKAKSENFFRVAEPVDFFCQRVILCYFWRHNCLTIPVTVSWKTRISSTDLKKNMFFFVVCSTQYAKFFLINMLKREYQWWKWILKTREKYWGMVARAGFEKNEWKKKWKCYM